MNLREAFSPPTPTIVLADNAFGMSDGKTANGVVMHSDVFSVEAVVDTERAGQTADEVLDRAGVAPVPIVESTRSALDAVPDAEAFILGVAPAGGQLPSAWREDIRRAIAAGCDVVSGLHTFLGEDEELASLAADHSVELFDVREPLADDALRVADGRVDDADAAVVLVAGSDCAVGKRTTTVELYTAARAAGLDVGWVATGQTGIMVGAHAGVAIDRVPADFTAGVVEDLVCDVAAEHDLVFVEGQAALAHRAYAGVTLSILHGAWPDAVVLAHDPDRDHRAHFERFGSTDLGHEIDCVETLSDASVAAVSSWNVPATEPVDVPVANVYDDNGPARLLDAVRRSCSEATSSAQST
ncbi:DUF1611 domain-containing protein [Halococcus agarilyticus]|uniref:DUF1611 domain-containing protein n=1 Tax=Halococcus agarilyticus TaxID=1232219 RepID=UPI000677BECF|nr:DUF1611 domain-containing protein [Halococcus agarilyticus]